MDGNLQQQKNLQEFDKKLIEITDEELDLITTDENRTLSASDMVGNVLKKHLSSYMESEVSEEEMAAIKKMTEDVKPPSFEFVSRTAYDSKGKFGKKSYRKKAKKYLKEKAEEIRKNKQFSRMKTEMFNRVKNPVEAPYHGIKAEPDAMEKAYAESVAEYKENENAPEGFINKKYLSLHDRAYDRLMMNLTNKDKASFEEGLTQYSGSLYSQINNYKRYGTGGAGSIFAEKLDKGLENAKIPADQVVRRGVHLTTANGDSVLAKMFGLKDGISPDQFKEMYRKGEIKTNLLTEKGYCSTTMSGTAYGNEEYKMQFIILLEKGCKGLYIDKFTSAVSSQREEEVLLASGTRFQLVKVYFNDGQDDMTKEESDKAGAYQKPGVWKVYLKALAPDAPGQPKEA